MTSIYSSLFSLALSLLPFGLILYYFRLMRKRDLISYYINSGIRCYSCKTELIPMDKEYFRKIEILEKEGKNTLRLCTSCERDKNINILFSKRREQMSLSFKKFILTDRYRKIQQRVTIACVFIPILGLVLKYAFGLNNNLTEIANLINVIIWVFMIYQLKSTSVLKKKTQT